jgi:hypothetical protein
MHGRRDALAMQLWRQFMSEHPGFSGSLTEEQFADMHGGGRAAESGQHAFNARARRVDGAAWMQAGAHTDSD